MNRFLKKWPLPLILLACIGVTILTSKRLSSVTPSRQEVSTNNKTQSLQIVRAEILDQDFKVVVRNLADKNITGFEVGMGNGITYQTEFLYSDRNELIMPGKEYEQTYSIEDGLMKEGLTLLAIVFEDGSSEGDLRTIQKIQAKREGTRDQLRRIIPLLEEATKAPSEKLQTALVKLESQVSSIQIEENHSDDMKAGLQSGKERVLVKIHSLQGKQLNNTDIQIQLLAIKTREEQIASKLSN